MARLSFAVALLACSPVLVHAQEVVSDTGDGLSLAQLLALAERRSPSLAVADARMELAEAERTAAAPLLPANPNVQAMLGQRRAGGEGDREIQLAIQQRVEIAGEPRRRREVARRVGERLEAERAVTRSDIRRRVVSAFRLALVAEARVAIAGDLVGQQERVVQVAERRAELGEGSPMEARLAEVELLRARQAMAAVTTRALSRRWALAALVGWEDAEPPRPSGTLDVPEALPELSSLMRHVQEQPRVVAARARAAEARAREALAARQGAPQPTLGFQFNSEGAPQGGVREQVFAGTIALPIPLWQRNQGGRARASAERAIAEAELDGWERRLEPTLRQLASLASGARARAELVATELVPAVERATANLDRAFELGEIDLLTLLAARERMLRARVESLDAHRIYYEAVAELEGLLGLALEDLR